MDPLVLVVLALFLFGLGFTLNPLAGRAAARSAVTHVIRDELEGGDAVLERDGEVS